MKILLSKIAMKHRFPHVFMLILLGLLAGVNVQANIALEPADTAQVAAQYGKLPMSFEANRGQTDPAVRFLSRGPGYALFITRTEAVFSLRKPEIKTGDKHSADRVAKADARRNKPSPEGQLAGMQAVEQRREQLPRGNTNKSILPAGEAKSTAPAEMLAVRMQLVGANPNAGVAGQDELPGKANYLRGNDPKQWQTDVATYGKVKLNGVYDGVDLVYYGNGRQLEYDFIVQPGADPNDIRLNFSGTDKVRLDAAGDLLLHTKEGELRLHKPIVYQTIGGKRQNVEGRFVLHEAKKGSKNRQIGFQVADYDVGQALVIDPVLVYSTFLGGSGRNYPKCIAVDGSWNVYVVEELSVSSRFNSITDTGRGV